MEQKVTVPEIVKAKASGRPIVALTAYDFPFARIADEAGVDVILVGDSLGMVVQGFDTTLPVTMDEMVYHTRMVARGAAPRAARRRPAVPVLPGQPGRGGGQRRPPDQGRRRRGGEARGRPRRRRDDRAHRVGRHPGDGPHRPHAAVGAPHGRPQGAGPPSRPGAGPARAPDRGRAGGRGGGRVRHRARGHPARSRRRDHRAARRSRPSASAPGVHCDGQILVLHDVLGLCERVVAALRQALRRALVGGARRRSAPTPREVRGGAFPTAGAQLPVARHGAAPRTRRCAEARRRGARKG